MESRKVVLIALISLGLGFAAGQWSTRRPVAPVKESAWQYPVPAEMYEPPQRYGYKDATGRPAFPHRYEDARHFAEGLAMVRVTGKWGYINLKGETVIPPRFDAVRGLGFEFGAAQVMAEGRWRRIDWRGNYVD